MYTGAEGLSSFLNHRSQPLLLTLTRAGLGVHGMACEEASEGSEGVDHICAGCGGRGLVGHAVPTGDSRYSAQGARTILQVNSRSA